MIVKKTHNPKKKSSPSHQLRDEPTDDKLYGSIEQYPISEPMEIRSILPWLQKAKLGMKNLSQSPSYFPPQFKEEEKLYSEDVEKSVQGGKDVSKSPNKFVFGSSSDSEGVKSDSEDE